MQYAIIVYETQEELNKRNDPKQAEGYWGSYFAYSKALGEAGVARGGAGLQSPDTATTVMLKNGKKHVQDGPYAETKEMLGGFFLIEVENLDAALDWAAKCPAVAGGRVEVRPLLPPPPMS